MKPAHLLISARSNPINIENLGAVHLQLTPPSAQSPRLLRADVLIEGASIFVIISEEKRGWPLLLDNTSDYDVIFSQTVGVLIKIDLDSDLS